MAFKWQEELRELFNLEMRALGKVMEEAREMK
jgi:hypothetical protein